jgi:hypothetical protein
MKQRQVAVYVMSVVLLILSLVAACGSPAATMPTTALYTATVTSNTLQVVTSVEPAVTETPSTTLPATTATTAALPTTATLLSPTPSTQLSTVAPSTTQSTSIAPPTNTTTTTKATVTTSRPVTTSAVPSTTSVTPPTFLPISVPPVPVAQTFSAQEQAAVNLVIAQLKNSFTSFLACLYESVPKNPGSEALFAAKIKVLEDPELYNKIVNGNLFLVDTAPSTSGKSIAFVAVYPTAAMRAEAWYALQVAKLSLPLLEEFMGTPLPSTVITVHYGFMMGSSGGGGGLILEDRTTYMGRWKSPMMPYDPVICHELSHAYIGHEGLNQFLEIFVYNRLLGRTSAFGDWAFVRDYTTWKGTKTGFAAMLDIYQLIGLGATKSAYRTVYQLKPPYGQVLPENCKQAFVDQAPEALKAQVRAIVTNITY